MGYALRRMWLPQRVASLLWNQWQLCRGMRGKLAMESVASFAWNRWQLSYGTGGNFRAEYAGVREPASTCSHIQQKAPSSESRKCLSELGLHLYKLLYFRLLQDTITRAMLFWKAKL